MRKIRTDHESGLVTAPHGVEHLRDLFRTGVTDDQRQQRDVPEQQLEKRNLDLERMFLRVGRMVGRYLRQLRNPSGQLGIDSHFTQRRGESCRARQGQAAQPDLMSGPQQHHPANPIGCAREKRKRGPGNRTRVVVAGVGRDDRLGRLRKGRGCGHRRRHRRTDVQMRPDRRRQLVWIGGIEKAGHRRLPHALLVGQSDPSIPS